MTENLSTAESNAVAAEVLGTIQDQAKRYLEAVYGKDVWFRAPETFQNVLERWIWAVASSAEELMEESVATIERMARENRERAGE